jgi:hypothetical protein
MSIVMTQVSPALIDAIGVAGFGLYVLNYTLLTFGRVCSRCITYFAINWVAASCVLVGLTASFNLASALIQVFWICISTVAILIRLRGRVQPRLPA